jgi:hypothetical protein
MRVQTEDGLDAVRGARHLTGLTDWLPACKKAEARSIGSPKFYFADVGIVNHLSRRGVLAAGSELHEGVWELGLS